MLFATNGRFKYSSKRTERLREEAKKLAATAASWNNFIVENSTSHRHSRLHRGHEGIVYLVGGRSLLTFCLAPGLHPDPAGYVHAGPTIARLRDENAPLRGDTFLPTVLPAYRRLNICRVSRAETCPSCITVTGLFFLSLSLSLLLSWFYFPCCSRSR